MKSQIRAALGISVLQVTFLGCAGMFPDLRTKHPVGLDAAIAAAPQCAKVSFANYAACDSAATIMESPPRKAIVLLLAHVERTLAELDADIEKHRRQGDLTALNNSQYGKAEQVELANQIVLPATKVVLQRMTADQYGKLMLPHLELLVADAPSSRESLREAHLAALQQAGLPPP